MSAHGGRNGRRCRAPSDGRIAHFLVQFADVVLSQKPLRAAAGGLAGRRRAGGLFLTG
ncbi:acyl-CoA hydrolase [Burkholderia multivorans]|nr:acyl-CoA hydrolase [Burkholderia multivorans]PRE71678.1 acyl-CoA hydrolase [Burkholderia multivorans]PRE72818.1 acyl-CoA hydrolase [Burkholderia multivorans]PRE75408.1 acyl-CoA hydrolase [Burkholderia multivorans]PRF12768.1 acyl-CoA hydrolase [Burkholderia multivorans]